MPIDEVSLKLLKSIYDSCCTYMNVKPGQLVIKTMDATQPSITRALTASAYPSPKIDPNIVLLERQGFITSCQPGVFSITAHGAWLIEINFYSQNTTNIIDHINRKYLFANSKIDEKNKVILFATIAAHAFEENSSIEPKKMGQDVFMNLMKCSYKGLKKLNRVREESFDSFIKSGKGNSKTPTATMMNKINSLPQSTFGLYYAASGKYWISLYKDGELDITSLKKLLSLVFGNISISEMEEICNLCRLISSEYGIYCTSKIDPVFDSMIDNAICDTITEIAMGF